MKYYIRRFATFATYYKISPMVGKSVCITVYDDGEIHINPILAESEIERATKIQESEYLEVKKNIIEKI